MLSVAEACSLVSSLPEFSSFPSTMYYILKDGYYLRLEVPNSQKVLLRMADEEEYDYQLRGKAWKVYWLLLRNGRPMSVREVEKALRFSSPSVAHHHLEQLCQLGLVKHQKIGGNYVLVGKVKIGVLRHFVKLGRLVFPRYFFYALFSSAFYIAYITILLQELTRENLFILSFGAIVTIIFWYEAIRFWRLKPF